MPVEDAETADIYADASGKLWRILEVVREPRVIAEEVEGTLFDPNVPVAPHFPGAAGIGLGWKGTPTLRAEINKRRVNGGMTGAMWEGWHRIYRKVE